MSSTRLYRPSCLDQWVEGVLHGLKMGFIWGAVEGTYYRFAFFLLARVN